jgi:carbon storage regulator
MLVLSRKLNETIVIDDNIRITVIGVKGAQVRLGIEAPEEIGIYREELLLPGRGLEAVEQSPYREAPSPRSARIHR